MTDEPVELPIKPKKKYVNTQLRLDTITRLDWVRRHRGAQVTDIVDSAVNDFLDRAGIPRPVNGVMPEEDK